MLEARKQLQQAKSEGNKNYLNHKFEKLDKEMEQLYGLTDASPPKVYRRRKEIKIVEESVK